MIKYRKVEFILITKIGLMIVQSVLHVHSTVAELLTWCLFTTGVI